VGLGLYNQARFGVWWETGVGHQLSTMKLRTSIHYVLPNVWSYLLRPPALTCHFPFVVAPWRLGARGFPRGFVLPAGYWTSEPVAGLLLTAPWVFLIPVGLWGAMRKSTSGSAEPRRWAAATFAVLALVTVLPTLAMFIASMRYLADARTGLVLLATLGAFTCLDADVTRPWLRRSIVAGCVGLAVVTIFMAVALGFVGYFGHFEQSNPRLWHELQRLGCGR
jgi:hypothetical protein